MACELLHRTAIFAVCGVCIVSVVRVALITRIDTGQFEGSRIISRHNSRNSSSGRPQNLTTESELCAWMKHPLYRLYPEVSSTQLPQTRACRSMVAHLRAAEAACKTHGALVVFMKGVALGAFRHASLAPGDNDVDAYVLHRPDVSRQQVSDCFLGALMKVHPHERHWNAQYEYYGIESKIGSCNSDLLFGRHVAPNATCLAPLYGTLHRFRSDVPQLLEQFYGMSVHFLLPTSLKGQPQSAVCQYVLATLDSNRDSRVAEEELLAHYRTKGERGAEARVRDSGYAGRIAAAVGSTCSKQTTERIH